MVRGAASSCGWFCQTVPSQCRRRSVTCCVDESTEEWIGGWKGMRWTEESERATKTVQTVPDMIVPHLHLYSTCLVGILVHVSSLLLQPASSAVSSHPHHGPLEFGEDESACIARGYATSHHGRITLLPTLPPPVFSPPCSPLSTADPRRSRSACRSNACEHCRRRSWL
jgi:hypothetical protein